MSSTPTLIPIGGTSTNAAIQAALAAAQAAGTFTPTATGGVSLPVQQLFSDMSNARSFGAKCNALVTEAGVLTAGIDDTAAVQALLNAAAVNSASATNPNWDLPVGLSVDWDGGNGSQINNMPQGTARLPAGSLMRVSGTLTIPAGVRFDLNYSILLMVGAGTIIEANYSDVNVGTTQKNYTGGSATSIVNGFIWGLTGQSVSTGVGIDLLGLQGFELHNLVIGGNLCGLRLIDCQYGSVSNVYCLGNLVNGVFTGTGTNGTIDVNVHNCRFAKSLGIGLWMHHCTNITLTQVDCNFCDRVNYLFGPAITDGPSAIAITNPGAGYPADGQFAVTITDTQGAGFQGAVTITGGKVTAAIITCGIGTGAGCSSSGCAVNIPASVGTPTTAAALTPVISRDATSVIGSLVTNPTTGSATLINFIDAKAEPNAPSCGYAAVMSNSDVKFYNRTFATYLRGLTAYYKFVWMGSGTLHDYDGEFDGNAGTLVNPGFAGDIALWRVISGAARIRIPHNSFTGVLSSLATGSDGNPEVGGQVYIEMTMGNSLIVPSIAMVDGSYGGNPRIAIKLPGDVGNRFYVDGGGNLFLGTGAASTDVELTHPGGGQVALNGLPLTPGYKSIQTLNGNATLADFVDTVIVHSGTLTLANPSLTNSSTAARQVRVYCWFQTASITVVNPTGGLYTAAGGVGSITVNQGASVLLQDAGGGNWIQVG